MSIRRWIVQAAILIIIPAGAFGKTVTYTIPEDLRSIELTTDAEGYAHFPRGVLDAPHGEVGAPALPSRTVLFAVPPGYEAGEVTVAADWVAIAEDVLLYPVQEPQRTGTALVFTPPAPEYYTLDSYPETSFIPRDLAIASGVRLQPVLIVPFRYEPSRRTLYAATSYTVTLELKEPKGLMPTADEPPAYSYRLRSMVADLVVNSEDVDTSQAEVSGFQLTPTADLGLATSLPITGTVPDYVLISPSAFVSAWTTYVAARAAKFPDLDFAVVNADLIYSTYDSAGRNDAERVHAFIKEQAALGTTYFVLGGQSRRQDWGTDKVNALSQSIDRSNSIPTCLNAASQGSNWLPSDMFFACHDIKSGTYPWDPDGDGTYLGNSATVATVDLVPDCVVTRISVMPFNYDGTGVKTAAQLIAAYTTKLAEGEALDFAGRFKYAVGGSSLNYVSYYHDHASARTTEHEFHDETYNFYDTRRGAWIDCERLERWRVPQYYTKYRPTTGGTTIFSGGAWDPDSANVNEARKAWFASDWEIISVDGHGWAMGTSGFDASTDYTSPTYYNVRCATGLTKFYPEFCM